jgi:acyl dehydratase
MVEVEQFFEDYVLGDERITGGRTITETDIVTHAMHSGDFYPHHVDAELKKDLLGNVLLNLAVLSLLVLP